MGYYIDLDKITIDNYRIKLESIYLPPSRMVLKDRIDERFGYFKSIGINNLKELILLLRNKNKFSELSAINCLSNDYLTILLRELNSLLPKPRKLSEFTFVNKEITHLIKVKNMSERKAKLIEGSDAIVALPGGCGTLDELLEVITLKQLGKYNKPIIIVNVDGFYNPLIEMLNKSIDEGFMEENHRNLWTVVDNIKDILNIISQSMTI